MAAAAVRTCCSNASQLQPSGSGTATLRLGLASFTETKTSLDASWEQEQAGQCVTEVRSKSPAEGRQAELLLIGLKVLGTGPYQVGLRYPQTS